MPQEQHVIPIERIRLDHENPRIKQFVAMYSEGDLSEDQMLLALGAAADYEDTGTSQGSYARLKQSIRASHGVIQPIIVKPDGGNTYLCVEGNTRVAIYRELAREAQDRGEAGDEWRAIPAIVDSAMDAMEAHKVRLQVHLVGNRPWNPYSKAQYLYELKEIHKMSMSELVAFCGGNRKDVEESIAAFLDMEEHYRPLAGPEGFDVTRYSAFKELQAPRLRAALHENGYDEGHFAQWVHDRKIDPLATVRQLPKILAHRDAKRAFLRNGAREATKHLHVRDLNVRLREAPVEQLAATLLEKLEQMDFEEHQAIRDGTLEETSSLLAFLHAELDELFGRATRKSRPDSS